MELLSEQPDVEPVSFGDPKRNIHVSSSHKIFLDIAISASNRIYLLQTSG